MLTNALSPGSSRRAYSAAVKLIARRAVASSFGQSGNRAAASVMFEYAGFNGSLACAGGCPSSGNLLFSHCYHFRLEGGMEGLARFVAVAGLVSLTCIPPALAQDWPPRPVTMVVPFAAGGPADTVGRILA